MNRQLYMPPMKRIKSNYHELQVLRRASPELKKAIISNCNKELLNAISEIALNVLQGNIELPVLSRQKLRKHKTALRELADRRKQLRRSAVKRRVLNQRGGFLLPLLGAVLPTIASLLFK
jgi:site-specific DNA-adenine methylase